MYICIGEDSKQTLLHVVKGVVARYVKKETNITNFTIQAYKGHFIIDINLADEDDLWRIHREFKNHTFRLDDSVKVSN